MIVVGGCRRWYAIGALFAAVVLRFGDASALVQAVRGVFTALCGMSFPIVVLPDWAQTVALNPPAHLSLADLRAVLLSGSELGRVIGDLGILAARAPCWRAGNRAPSGTRSTTPAAADGWPSTDADEIRTEGRAAGRWHASSCRS